jgi:hypothetical protein
MEAIKRARGSTTRNVTTEVIGFDDDEDFKIIKTKTNRVERDHWIDRKLAYLFLKEHVTIYIVSPSQAQSCYKLQNVVRMIKHLGDRASLPIIRETARCFKTKEGKEISVIHGINVRGIPGKAIFLVQSAAYVKDDLFTKVINQVALHKESRIILTND